MANSSKLPTKKDFGQVLKTAYNDVDASVTTSGFLTGKVGNKVSLAISTTSITNDTETFTYFDGATQLHQIKVIYTDGNRTQMVSAERIS